MSTHDLPTFNVADQPGWTGDGQSDVSAPIQAAIDAAHAAGGGIVWIPEGVHKVEGPLRMSGLVQLLMGGPPDHLQ